MKKKTRKKVWIVADAILNVITFLCIMKAISIITVMTLVNYAINSYYVCETQALASTCEVMPALFKFLWFVPLAMVLFIVYYFIFRTFYEKAKKINRW